MSRSKKNYERVVKPDYKYNSPLVTMFINKIMLAGKKSLAERIFYNSLEILQNKTETTGITALEQAVQNVSPNLILKSRRVGGANYQVPVEVPTKNRHVVAIKWILKAAKARKEHTMEERLSAELYSASKNEACASLKQKETTYKMAESNKAFAHFRWN